ncbi:MAG: transcriptional regulator [Desulfovibrio sp.]|nr:transcriptional regulator [Desulfovibrio sp.]
MNNSNEILGLVSTFCGVITKPRLNHYFELHPEFKVPQYEASEVKSLRSFYSISQSVLAKLLNTSTSTVRSWEFGSKKPCGSSCKLLSLLERKGIQGLL